MASTFHQDRPSGAHRPPNTVAQALELSGRAACLGRRDGAGQAPSLRRLWAWTALVLAATVLPEVLASAFGPRDLVRVHTFLNVWDFNVYLAAMREAAASGGWMVHNHFAAEPHQPALIHVPYVAVAQLARLLGLDVMAVYVPAELVGRAVVVAAAYVFVRLLLPDGPVRLIAFLLALLGSGLSLWVALGGALTGTGLPPESLYYETNTLVALFSGLHLMLALGLSVAIVSLFARLDWGSGGWRQFLPLGGASTLLALTHPHNLPVLCTAFGLYALIAGWQRQAVPWRAAAGLATVGLAAAPVLGYQYLAFVADPFWSTTHTAQNVVPSPPGLGLVTHLGLPLILALVGLVVWREGGERRLLVGALVLATLAWMYAPLPFQRRFAFGMLFYLAVPAAVALFWLHHHLPAPVYVWRRVLHYSAIAGAGGTAVAMYLGVLASAATGAPYPVYQSTVGEAAAARWLAERMASDQVVLSGLESGYLLGAQLPGRVVLGHPHETPNFTATHALVGRFFDPPTDASERLAIARSIGAEFVFYGPVERRLGPPPRGPGFELIYDRDSVAIYQVRHE